MTTTTMRTRRPTPPGPFGRWETSAKTGRRVVALNEEGKAAMIEWLGKWPKPVKLLMATFPGCVRLALRLGVSREDVEQAALAGAAEAMARYDPATGNQFSTYAAHRQRSYLQKHHITPRRRQRETGWGEGTLDRDAVRLSWLNTAQARPDLCTDRADWDTVRRRVYRVVREVVTCWRDREVFAARYGLVAGLSVPAATVGRAFDLTAEEVEEVTAEVMDRIRPHLERLAVRL